MIAARCARLSAAEYPELTLSIVRDGETIAEGAVELAPDTESGWYVGTLPTD